MTTGAGRPAVLGLDVGGTKVAAAVVTADGHVHHRARVDTPRAGPAGAGTVWAAVRRLVAAVVAHAAAGGLSVTAVGVGSAGPVDLTAGTVSPVNIPAWRDFPLVEKLRSAVPGPMVRLAGDGVAAACGEYRFGAGRGSGSLLTMVVSTGVGGGLVVGGRPFAGPTGNAGHVGHTVVELDGPACPCGGRGCLEALASGPGMVGWALDHGWSRPTGSPDAAGLAAAARRGDPVARAAFARAGRALGAAIVSAAALYDLDRVVVGGGVARSWDLLAPALGAGVAEYGRLPFVRRVEVRRAALGDDVGTVGAAALALVDRPPVPPAGAALRAPGP